MKSSPRVIGQRASARVTDATNVAVPDPEGFSQEVLTEEPNASHRLKYRLVPVPLGKAPVLTLTVRINKENTKNRCHEMYRGWPRLIHYLEPVRVPWYSISELHVYFLLYSREGTGCESPNNIFSVFQFQLTVWIHLFPLDPGAEDVLHSLARLNQFDRSAPLRWNGEREIGRVYGSKRDGAQSLVG